MDFGLIALFGYLFMWLVVWVITIRIMVISHLKEYPEDKIEGDLLLISTLMGLVFGMVWPIVIVGYLVVRFAIKPIVRYRRNHNTSV